MIDSNARNTPSYIRPGDGFVPLTGTGTTLG